MRKVCLQAAILTVFLGVGSLLSAQVGPDMIVSNMGSIARNGTVGNITAYSSSSTSCAIGDQVNIWIDPNQSPVIGANIYRINSDGMLEQLGMSWLKHAFCAVNEPSCGSCQGTNCDTLGLGCADTYGTGLNGQQNNLGPRSEVNASAGTFIPLNDFSTGNSIYKRLQVRNDDINPALNAGATYFGVVQYITVDETAWGNMFNNNSWRRLNVGSQVGNGWNLNYTGATNAQSDPIAAWQNFSSNVDRVELLTDGGDGQLIIGTRVEDIGGGQFRYQYAIFNNNSHASVREFSVPLPGGMVVTDVQFNDVDYHSGEPFSLTDWSASQGGGTITWSTQTFAQNSNANAIRWGTTYSFSFVAPAPPATMDASLGLFRTSSPNTLSFSSQVPSGDFALPVTGLNCFENGSGIALSWSNGEAYSSIAITRDGLALTTLAGSATSFTDTTASVGAHTYGVTGTAGGTPAPTVECSASISPPDAPTGLNCNFDGNGIALNWTNGEAYSNVQIDRDGVSLVVLGGSATSYVDATAAVGPHNYAVRGIVGSDPSADATCVGDVPAGPVLLFDFRTDSGIYNYDQGTGAGSFLVSVYAQEQAANAPFGNPVHGFSVALAHDSNLLTATNVALSAPVAALAPEFFGPTIQAGGFVSGVIFDFDGVVTMMMTAETALLDVTYETNSAAFTGNGAGAVTNLDFDNTLSPVVFNQVALADSVAANAVPASGVISLEPATGSNYLRGDTSNDGVVSGLVDSLFLLNWQFSGGPVPPCFASADTTADGDVNGLTDSLYLLNWAFTSGPQPAAPFPACGPDAVGVANLGCDTPPSCK